MCNVSADVVYSDTPSESNKTFKRQQSLTKGGWEERLGGSKKPRTFKQETGVCVLSETKG